MTSDEMLQAITKHVTGAGSTQEFSQLKKRFEGHGYMLPSAAAALGYLIAKDELEATKEEKEELDVYDEVVEVIKNNFYSRGGVSPYIATNEIFTLIYKWLDGGLKEKGHPPNGRGREDVKELFRPFIIK